MKLYNKNKDKIENVKYIDDNGIKYTKDMSDLALHFYGYYRIVYGEKPNRRYFSYIEHRELQFEQYYITYEPVDKNISQVKTLMFSDLEDTYQHNKNFAKMDTGLGFFVRASRDDMGDIARSAAASKRKVRDTEGTERTVSVPEMRQISEDTQENSTRILDTKWFKFDEVQAFTTLSECIIYENEPYEVDIVDDYGNVIGTETKYKNNIKDWE